MDRSADLTENPIQKEEEEEEVVKGIIRVAKESHKIQALALMRLFDWFAIDKSFISSVRVTSTKFAEKIDEASRLFPERPDIMISLPQMRLCTTIDEIGAMSDDDIEHSCAMLDRIEMTALAWYHQYPELSGDHKLMYAFNARIKFYHRFFVDHGAKHRGDHVLVAACDYLRSLRLNSRERSVHTEQNQKTLERMLRTIGARESYVKGVASYSFCSVDNKPAYILQDPNQMRDLGCRLYKAIQGQRIIQQLETQQNRAIVIGKDQNDNDKIVRVTRRLIDSLPFAAAAISKGREWEERAYTSCLGSSNDSASHKFERKVAALLATIDFNTNPDDIFAEIELLYRQKMLKKYLKYKEKYLNLKKQLNLL
jgi:hypothetical protein